jgi:hypothetical protein
MMASVVTGCLMLKLDKNMGTSLPGRSDRCCFYFSATTVALATGPACTS